MRGLLEVFVLGSLREGPKHGYALLKEMAERFGEEPNRNKLYPLLSRFEKEGLVRAVPDPAAERGRTPYELTDAGREELERYRRQNPAFRAAVAALWSPADPGKPSAVGVDDALPYPCAQARVTLEKSPRTGDLSLRLVGCPMGAYDYCPECPVFKGVSGLRALLSGGV